MSALHLAFSTAGLDAARARLRDGDEILLLGDGVYAACAREDDLSHPVYALAEDLTLRGVAPGKSVTVIDSAAMVSLTECHQPIVSWRE